MIFLYKQIIATFDIHCISLGPDAAGIIHAPFRARARATAQPRLKSYRFSPLKMFPMRQEKTTRGGREEGWIAGRG